ncbi:hypothetical protein [Stenotrophomonas sp. 278]|uniref:hypothetical protein n=1 Tax=Stenotrophomonas sp. 278 TaxID=2479851 RepID=UPI000F67DBDD|nr:hypothetical protein [Stenotrophomonas sp. 278]RRU22759.1 hypothetical protein EGJ34_03290 [Stenotrophomonas sp. 278]
MKTLFTLCLLAAATTAGSAFAQSPADAPAGSDCISLSSDKQLVRKNADRSILLRNGGDHYIVHLATSCNSASFSRRLDFTTPGQEGQLCGARASRLNTDQQSCDVTRLEPISAKQFASRAR